MATWRIDGAVRSDRGLVRDENQDAFGLFADLGLFVVADGLGGHRAGRIASRMVVDVVRDAFAAPAVVDVVPIQDPSGVASHAAGRLLRAVDDANASIWAAARDPERRGMGTTVAALLLDPAADVVALCHVGDCRIFRLRGDEVAQLTEDHTIVQQWVREGRIGPEDAARSPHRHMVTRAVGTQEVVEAALRLERPEDGDLFLLTSDGIHDGVTAAEMAAVVREATANLDEACRRLVDLANDRGGRDNATVVMVRIRNGGSGAS